MKKIYACISGLLLSAFYLAAQPVLYAPVAGNNNGNSTISKFVAGSNSLTAVHTFEDNGQNPNYANLVEGANGKYYGNFSNGGKYGYGFLYSIDPATSAYTKIKDLTRLDGGYAYAGMTKGPDNKLYGVSTYGGTYGYGAIYSYDPATNTYTKEKDLSYVDGYSTFGALFLSGDGSFYGKTNYGGANGQGTIFRFNPITSSFAVLYSITDNNYQFSYGGLSQGVDGKLYGVTYQGGVNNTGFIYSFDLNTNSYQVLFNFDANSYPYTNSTGSYAMGNLQLASNGKFYGTTRVGGANNSGTVFSFDPATTTYAVVKHLNNYSDGVYMQSGLVIGAGGKLYGTTEQGGTYGKGVIFSFDPNAPASSAYQKLKDLDDNTGSNPSWAAALTITSDGKLIGTTNNGGSYKAGVAFSYDPATLSYTKLHDFGNPDGKLAYGSLVRCADGKYYGMTYSGGASSSGVIYSFDLATAQYNKLKDLDNATGSNPLGSMINGPGNKLYGMTQYGGTYGYGVIFSFDPATLQYSKLKDLNYYGDGGYPSGNLFYASNGKFYGMTRQGGANSYGVLFSFDLNTSAYTKLKDFNSTDGGYPFGSLIEANGKMYGMTQNGGTSNYGVLFSFDLTSLVYSKIKDFDYNTTGSNPYGSLIKGADNKLYGMTSYGSSGGVLFSYDPASTTFSTELQASYQFGSGLTGSLFQTSNGKMYGMSNYGGNNSVGTVFSFDPFDKTGVKLQDFNYDNGFNTNYNSFIEEGGCTSLPQVTIATNSPVSSPVCEGATLTLSAGGGTTYQWSGPNGFTSTQQNPVIQDVTAGAAGTYKVTVGNGVGDCASSKSIEAGINPKPSGSITANSATTFCAGGSVGLNASFTANNQIIYDALGGNNGTFSDNLCNDGYTYIGSSSSFSRTLSTSASVSQSLQFKVYWSGYNSSVTFSFYLNGNLINSGTGNSSGFTCTPAAGTTYPSVFDVPQSAFAAYWNTNGSNTFMVKTSGGNIYIAGETVSFQGPSSISYQWSPATGLSDASISNPVASPSTTTTYTVTANTLAGCSASKNIIVNVNPQPVVSVSPAGPLDICTNGSVTLTATIGENSGTISTYEWFKDGNKIDGATNSTYGATASGTYTAKVKNNTQCDAVSNEVSVTVKPVPDKPTITTDGATTFCPGGSVKLTSSEGSSYKWSTGATTRDITVAQSGNYTVTVVNAMGCTSTSLATAVTVADNEKPTVVTQNIIVQLNASGAATITPAQINNGSTDNCTAVANLQLALDKTSFSCTNLGTPVTVTLTVTDASGNSDSKTATVTVEDKVKPTVVTHNITVQLDASGAASITPAQINNGSTDNCTAASNLQLALDKTSFSCTNVGTPVTVTLTVTDASGNSDSKTATVTVEDKVKPTVVTQNITAQLNSSGVATITPAQINNGSTDNCTAAANLQLGLDKTNFNCTNVGTPVTVTLTVTDANGNSDSKTATVRVEDKVKPTVVTQNIIVQLNASGAATITPAQINNGSTDNCTAAANLQLGLDKTNFNCTNVGTPVTVTLTVTDANGNSDSKTATATVVDNIPPTVTAPANISVNSDATKCYATIASLGTPTTWDNCTYTVSNNAPATFATGSTTVTWTIKDASNNSATATQTITVKDNQLPIVGTQNITRQLGSNGSVTIASSDINNGSTDNCGMASYTLDKTTFNCTNIGPNTVTLTATDVNGNQSSKTAIVTITAMSTTATVSVSSTTLPPFQYSDQVTFTATLTPGQIAGTCTPAGTVTFKVGTQPMGTATLALNSAGTQWTASLTTSLLEASSFAGSMTRGTKTVTAEFNSVGAAFNITNPSTQMTIAQEDATLTYNGSTYFTTPSNTNVTATATLSASVLDYNDGTSTRGDIRNAKVTFKEGTSYASGTLLGTVNNAVGLVTPSMLTDGLSTTTFNYTLGNNDITAGGKIFQVFEGASGYYTGTDGPTPITLALPGLDNVSGGGYQILNNSGAGTYAGTANSKMNFGFTVKYNKSGKNLQGQINIIFRRSQLVNGVTQLRVYQIKSNAINSIAVNTEGGYYKASINTKATLNDITDPLNVVSYGGNHNLRVDGWDNTTDNGGSLDKIGVSLISGADNSLLFASSWSNNALQLLGINGGNLNIKTSSTSTTATAITATSQQAVISQESIAKLQVRALPNPSNHQFTLVTKSGSEKPVTLRVIDILGRVIENRTVSANGSVVIGLNYMHGTYVVEMLQGSEKVTLKLLKQPN